MQAMRAAATGDAARGAVYGRLAGPLPPVLASFCLTPKTITTTLKRIVTGVLAPSSIAPSADRATLDSARLG
jgi:hypothetical protein